MAAAGNEMQGLLIRTRTELARAARGKAGSVDYKNDTYEELECDTALKLNVKYACWGNSREVILVDMSSARLAAFFTDCFKEVDELALTQPADSDTPTTPAVSIAEEKLAFNIKTPEAALQRIGDYVAMRFTPQQPAEEVECRIKDVVAKLGENNMIPLETLLENNLAVCRHKVLLVGYLLIQLLHRTNPTDIGAVFRFRTELVKNQVNGNFHAPVRVPHAITLFEMDDHRIFLLDTTRRGRNGENGLVIDLTDFFKEQGSGLEQSSTAKILSTCYEGYSISELRNAIIKRYFSKDDTPPVCGFSV